MRLVRDANVFALEGSTGVIVWVGVVCVGLFHGAVGDCASLRSPCAAGRGKLAIVDPGQRIGRGVHGRFGAVVCGVSHCTRVTLSVMVLLIVTLTNFQLVVRITSASIVSVSARFFDTFLSRTLSLMMNIRFMGVLYRRSTRAIIRILVFTATHRVMIRRLKPTRALLNMLDVTILFTVHGCLVASGSSVGTRGYPGGARRGWEGRGATCRVQSMGSANHV